MDVRKELYTDFQLHIRSMWWFSCLFFSLFSFSIRKSFRKMDLVEKMSEKKSSSSSWKKDQRFCFGFYSLLPVGGKFYRIVLIKLFIQQYTYNIYIIHISANGPVTSVKPEIKECQKANLLKNVKLFLHLTHPRIAPLPFTRHFLCACVPTSPWAINFISFRS